MDQDKSWPSPECKGGKTFQGREEAIIVNKILVYIGYIDVKSVLEGAQVKQHEECFSPWRHGGSPCSKLSLHMLQTHEHLFYQESNYYSAFCSIIKDKAVKSHGRGRKSVLQK
jgi:hypothetical protein